jgi:hypothetical protein
MPQRRFPRSEKPAEAGCIDHNPLANPAVNGRPGIHRVPLIPAADSYRHLPGAPLVWQLFPRLKPAEAVGLEFGHFRPWLGVIP